MEALTKTVYTGPKIIKLSLAKIEAHKALEKEANSFIHRDDVETISIHKTPDGYSLTVKYLDIVLDVFVEICKKEYISIIDDKVTKTILRAIETLAIQTK